WARRCPSGRGEAGIGKYRQARRKCCEARAARLAYWRSGPGGTQPRSRPKARGRWSPPDPHADHRRKTIMLTYDKLYIDGQWVAPKGTGVIDVINPSTEEICGRVPAGNEEDVNAAVAAAK